MANKRDLKKFFKNVCGSIAGDMIMAGFVFPDVEQDDVQDIVRKVAEAQSYALDKCSISFDKVPRDFENKAEYHKARRQYYANAYSQLMAVFNLTIDAIIKEMNASMPDDVKAVLKEAANK